MKRQVPLLLTLLLVISGCSKEKVDWSPPVQTCFNKTSVVDHRNIISSSGKGLEGALELVRYGSCGTYSFWAQFTQTGEWLPLEVIAIRAGFDEPENLIASLEKGNSTVRTSSVSVGSGGFINACVRDKSKPTRICLESGAYQVPPG